MALECYGQLCYCIINATLVGKQFSELFDSELAVGLI